MKSFKQYLLSEVVGKEWNFKIGRENKFEHDKDNISKSKEILKSATEKNETGEYPQALKDLIRQKTSSKPKNFNNKYVQDILIAIYVQSRLLSTRSSTFNEIQNNFSEFAKSTKKEIKDLLKKTNFIEDDVKTPDGEEVKDPYKGVYINKSNLFNLGKKLALGKIETKETVPKTDKKTGTEIDTDAKDTEDKKSTIKDANKKDIDAKDANTKDDDDDEEETEDLFRDDKLTSIQKEKDPAKIHTAALKLYNSALKKFSTQKEQTSADTPAKKIKIENVINNFKRKGNIFLKKLDKEKSGYQVSPTEFSKINATANARSLYLRIDRLVSHTEDQARRIDYLNPVQVASRDIKRAGKNIKGKFERISKSRNVQLAKDKLRKAGEVIDKSTKKISSVAGPAAHLAKQKIKSTPLAKKAQGIAKNIIDKAKASGYKPPLKKKKENQEKEKEKIKSKIIT